MANKICGKRNQGKKIAYWAKHKVDSNLSI